MPDALEYVVRPYQTPGVHGTIIIPATPIGTREKATLTWGTAGTMPDTVETAEGDGLAFDVVCCQEKLGEDTRTSETKRIYQNNDTSSSNWVDVRRPLTLKLHKREKPKCSAVSQLSLAAQEVNATLNEFNDAIHSGTAAPPKDKNCSVEWRFKNEPAA